MNIYTLEVVFNCLKYNVVTLKEGEATTAEIQAAEDSEIAIYNQVNNIPVLIIDTKVGSINA